jgi:hypothetical protein
MMKKAMVEKANHVIVRVLLTQLKGGAKEAQARQDARGRVAAVV